MKSPWLWPESLPDFDKAMRSARGGNRGPVGTLPRAIARALLVGGVFLAAASWSVAQEENEEDRFKNESLRLRTALHQDPNLDKPLKALVQLYFDAERSKELVGIYKNHVSEYPEDTRAKTVLDRILRRLDELVKDSGPSQEGGGGDENGDP